ncbi:MAG TPA: hypothetical protein LFV91_07270 [Rickettsia endosymbiont of Bembidion nr. Transversale]|nr:hypothetical protein [Rickettsia endosymbiont of Bembidion nr. Transversale]
MNLVSTKIISNISNLTNIEKEFIADRYDAILFNNGNLRFKASHGYLPQFQEEIIKLLDIELFREVIIEHIFLYEIKFCEEELRSMRLNKAQEKQIQEKINEINILKTQYKTCISISAPNNLNDKAKIKTLLSDYYSAVLNSVQCSSYLDSLYNFASSSCDSYNYDSYDGTFYIPREELKEWEEMQQDNDKEIKICSTQYKELHTQQVNLQEQLSQLVNNL